MCACVCVCLFVCLCMCVCLCEWKVEMYDIIWNICTLWSRHNIFKKENIRVEIVYNAHGLMICSIKRYPNSTSNKNQINEYYWMVRVEGGSNCVATVELTLSCKMVDSVIGVCVNSQFGVVWQV